MAVVTINGPVGAGGTEVGIQAAHILNADYVDRLIFAEAAKRMKATVTALVGKEEEVLRRRDRVARFLQTLLERSAISGAGGEPYFGPGLDVLLSRDYAETTKEPVTETQKLDDQRFIQVTSTIIKELANRGNVVIAGRGGNLILKDRPDVLHIGLVAPKERRIQFIMEREHLDYKAADQFVEDYEKARIAYFAKFFNVHPHDPSLYHMVMNMGALKVDTAAEIIVHAAQDLAI